VVESTLQTADGPVTGTRFDELRQQLLKRRLHNLRAAQRVAAIALMCSTVVAMTFVALLVFGCNPIGPDPSHTTWHAVGGVVVFVGLLLALTVLAGTLDVTPTAGWAGRPMAAVDRLLPFTGLVAVGYSLVVLQPSALAQMMGTHVAVPAIALWLAFAVACVYVSRRVARNARSLFDEQRTAKAGLPAVLLLVMLVGAIAVAHSPDVAATLLMPTLVLAAFAAIAVLPAVSAASAVKGLDAVRDRGERAVRFARRRPWLVTATAVFKLLAIVVVCVVSHGRRPNYPLLGSTLGIWVLASGAAVFVMVLFVLDRRFGLAAADHPVVSRTTGLLLGGSLGGLIAVAFIFGTLVAVVPQPLPVIGVAVLLALGAATGRLGDRRARLVTYAAALVLAILAAIFLTHAPGEGISDLSPKVLNMPVVGSVLGVGLTIGVVCMVVRIRRTRRFTWFVQVAAVVIWIVFAVFCALFAKTMTMLNVDVALTLLMTVAAVLLALRVQRKIDAFEITVTLAATFILIELPLITALMPYPQRLNQTIAAIALLTPGCVALWAGTKMLAEPSEQRAGMSRLAVSSLLYYLLLALVWAIESIDIPGLISLLVTSVVGFLTIPLVLLLVAAGESGAYVTRQRPADQTAGAATLE
jgi:hypothetical protein